MPLTRNRPAARTRFAMERTRFEQPGACGRCGDHVRLRAGGASSEIGADDRGVAKHDALGDQLPQEGGASDGMTEKKLEVQLFGPGLVFGVGEGGYAGPWPRVVDEHGGRAEAAALALGGEALLRRRDRAHRRCGAKSLACGRLARRAGHGAIEALGNCGRHSANPQHRNPRSCSTVARARLPEEPTGHHRHAAREGVGREEGC